MYIKFEVFNEYEAQNFINDLEINPNRYRPFFLKLIGENDKKAFSELFIEDEKLCIHRQEYKVGFTIKLKCKIYVLIEDFAKYLTTEKKAFKILNQDY